MSYLEKQLLSGAISAIDVYQEDFLMDAIKIIRESSHKIEIVKACEPYFFVHPEFWFSIIYDLEEYFADTLELKELLNREFNNQECTNISRFKKGREYIINNLQTLVESNEEIITLILDIYFKDYEANKDAIEKLLYNTDMHIRFLTLNYLILRQPLIFPLYGENIISIITKTTPKSEEMMNESDMSTIAYSLFITQQMEAFNKAKELLFSKFKVNDLGYKIFRYSNFYLDSPTKEAQAELESDIDRYFMNNPSIRFYIYSNLAHQLSEESLAYFKRYLRVYQKVKPSYVNNIYFNHLGAKLEHYITKYLDLSSNNKDVHPAQSGLEVSPYLKRGVEDVPVNYFNEFIQSLYDLGYIYLDNLRANIRLLNSYQDAYINNPEDVPDWFKEYPIVLVDRDLVVKIDEDKRRH